MSEAAGTPASCGDDDVSSTIVLGSCTPGGIALDAILARDVSGFPLNISFDAVSRPGVRRESRLPIALHMNDLFFLLGVAGHVSIIRASIGMSAIIDFRKPESTHEIGGRF